VIAVLHEMKTTTRAGAATVAMMNRVIAMTTAVLQITETVETVEVDVRASHRAINQPRLARLLRRDTAPAVGEVVAVSAGLRPEVLRSTLVALRSKSVTSRSVR
jgi:hypothetical protein